MRPVLARRLILEAPAQVPDGAGGFGESWTALGTVWAEINARTGRERDREGMGASLMGFRITLRGVPVGDPARPEAGQRFREGSRIFNISAVAEADAQGRYLICFAKEEVAT